MMIPRTETIASLKTPAWKRDWRGTKMRQWKLPTNKQKNNNRRDEYAHTRKLIETFSNYTFFLEDQSEVPCIRVHSRAEKPSTKEFAFWLGFT